MSASDLRVRSFGQINWVGLWTLYLKETNRFIKVWSQTLLGPVVSSLLFIIIFSLALGGADRMIGEVPLLKFLIPGLIMMTMIQNAFANSSSSIMIGKIQGNIVDILMPPLSAGEFLFAHVAGALTRGFLCGFVVWLAVMPFVDLSIHNGFSLVAYAVLANTILALLGMLAGIWAEKFDQMAAVTNFVITPLSFLSGTFYPLSALPEVWHWVALLNPFFYMIDGFRSAFLGTSDGPQLLGLIYVSVVALGLWFWAWWLIKRGYKIKA